MFFCSRKLLSNGDAEIGFSSLLKPVSLALGGSVIASAYFHYLEIAFIFWILLVLWLTSFLYFTREVRKEVKNAFNKGDASKSGSAWSLTKPETYIIRSAGT